MTSIPGEMFLLLTHESGRQEATQYRRQALVAAVLTELLLRERIALTEGRSPRVEVLDPAPTGVAELDQVLAHLTTLRSPRMGSLLGKRDCDVTETIGDAFAAAGEVRRKDGWFLTSWPAGSSVLEAELRARLGAVLQGTRRASLQDAVLLEILKALRVGQRILREESGGMSRRQLDRTVEALDVDVPAAAALRRMIDALNAAMATSASTTTMAGGS
ncbi:GOLPH3/VPS74 family protein [Brachybacterium squillarum]|uniref:GOLPH3/VPS74 family protein n=1 Tax=Brachybacterium squillarum TaxID=661979 RepID=UPI002223AC2F|nr:GPP34 family phosphoprotein [Brachybacterium squillarum]MCW1805511.1 GPP34 family phosphoprotein [Brachybacterium squillarum]